MASRARSTLPEKPLKLLVIRLSAFGDIVHLFYSLQDATRRIPNLEIGLLVDERFEGLAEIHPEIKTIHSVRLSPRTVSDYLAFPIRLWRTIRSVQRIKYDIAIDTQGMYKSAVLSFFSNARSRFGLPKERTEGLAHLFAGEVTACVGVPTLGPRLQFAEVLKYSIAGLELDSGLTLKPNQTTSFIEASKRVTLMPFSSNSRKSLTTQQVDDLLDNLFTKQFEIEVLWGSEAERDVVLEIKKRYPRVITHSKRYDYQGLVSRLQGSTLVIGPDTGLIHLSSALGLRTLALFTITKASDFYAHQNANSFFLEGKGRPIPSPELIACVNKIISNA